MIAGVVAIVDSMCVFTSPFSQVVEMLQRVSVFAHSRGIFWRYYLVV